MPEEYQDALKQTIIELYQELFQCVPQVISEHYGGEKFGKGIYYRLVYTSEEGKNWEVLFVFEEKLLMNTTGALLGEKNNNLNAILVNATRYMARQFIERLRAFFPTVSECEVKEENLLTYEQFQRHFEQQHPQSSLLFDTGEGYFAFCVVASHLLDEKKVPPIREDNEK